MAALVRTRVRIMEDIDDAESSLEDTNELNNSDGGSDDHVSSDGGNDGDDAEDEGGGLEEEEEEEEEEGNPNAGWAEAMAKILGKQTPKSKTTILVKNKELDKVKAKEKQEQLERKEQTDKKRAWEMMSRVKPDLVKDREVEKSLQRIATRGVVQLFNAVKMHQKNIDRKMAEVDGSERKKAKILSSVSKKDFIDVLRKTEGGARVKVKAEKDTHTTEVEEKPAWSVLSDDFMMGATMKDWDKEEHTGSGADGI
ncbi:RRP15-like protein isoform X2 [Syngnathus acus]|uniref:RRP15-like protein isoform X2 n=1 Tax=Syngnathus acus TaxID=161584 RepID=UPI001885CF10|nr:RRP15-like protein isoform X2 [Syngnathus acus]